MNHQTSTLHHTVDQASTHNSSKNKTRCIAISSGKGGVGKSIIALNLALELGLLGNQVGLLDLNFGVGTANRLCGLIPEFHLGHVIAGWKTLDEIKIELTKSVSLYPNVGDESLIDLAAGYSHILTKLQLEKKSADFILVDTASEAATPAAQITVATAISSPPIVTPSASQCVTGVPRRTSTPSRSNDWRA